MHFYEYNHGNGSQAEHAFGVLTDRAPDADGLVIMTHKQENDSQHVIGDRIGASDQRSLGSRSIANYHSDYDLTTHNGVAVIHPGGMPFNHPAINAALLSINGECPDL